jgi:hypothetical protein
MNVVHGGTGASLYAAREKDNLTGRYFAQEGG